MICWLSAALTLIATLLGWPVVAQAVKQQGDSSTSHMAELTSEGPSQELDGSFIRDWLVLGPFPSRDLEIDFLRDVGGELNVRPKEGDTVRTREGSVLVWTRLRSTHDVVDLEQVLQNLNWSVVYAYCELNSKESFQAEARAATWPGGPLWFNGKQVTWLRDGYRFDTPPTFPIRLSVGKNPLLVKLKFEQESPFSFSFQPLPRESAHVDFRITDLHGTVLPGTHIQFYDGNQRVAQFHTDSSGSGRFSLYPLSKVYDVRATSGDAGTWLSSLSLEPGEHRKIELRLSKAESISGVVQTLDGSPQTGIVVQAIPFDDEIAIHRDSSKPQPVQNGFYTGPTLVNADPGVPSSEGGGFGRPARATPLIKNPPFSQSVLSDTNGVFRFINLRSGKYRLRAHSSKGYVAPSGSLGLDSSQVFFVNPGRTSGSVRFIFAEAKKAVASNYPIRQGLVELVPVIVHRSPDGVLWVGTNERTIHSYDGVGFFTYSLPEVSGNYIRTMNHDSAGFLWIGTDKGINRLVDERIQIVPGSESHVGNNVVSIHRDSDGALWLGSSLGLVKYDGTSYHRLSAQERSPGNGIGGLLRTRRGELSMVTSQSLAQLGGQRFSELMRLSGPRPVTWGKLHEAKDGAIWYCNPDYEFAVYRYDGKTLSSLDKEDGLAGERIFDVAETSDGVLWFATDKGISRFDGTVILNYTSFDGIGLGEVRSILADSDDVLWCATYAGVSRLDTRTFSWLTKRDGLTNRNKDTASVFAIEPNTDGGYLLGTEWGGVYYLNGDSRDQLRRADFLENGYVRHIRRMSGGTTWFGTADGIYRQEAGQLEKLLMRNWIIAMTIDSQGNLWFGQGWAGGGTTRYNPKTKELTIFTKKEGLPDDSVWVLERASGDGVWIGTGAGLALFQGGEIDSIGMRLGIPPSSLRSLRQEHAGGLWLGGGGGLRRLLGTNIVSLQTINGAPVPDFWCDTKTSDGIHWIGTDKNGLLGYDGQAVTQIDRRDGLSGNGVFTLKPDKDGALLVGLLNNGIARFRRTKSLPSIRLTQARLEDEMLSDFGNLPRTEIGKRVSIQYQETDLKTHPDKRQFRYQLIGPKGQALFSGVTKDRTFEWTPRKGGTYSFEVQAIDRDLNYSKPARLDVHATVPWFANLWVMVPGGSLFGGLIIWAFVARVLFTRQRRETERLREQMLLQERQSREALELKARQLEIAKEAADSANRAKSAFLANMSHEIRTPLNVMLGYTQILRRKPSLASEDRGALSTIESSGNHLLSLINSVLDLSKIEAGGSELNTEDFDLIQLARDMSAMFQIRCQQKGLKWCVGFAWAGPSVPVHGDLGKLRQVLINLLGNALKFTEVGEVLLRIRFMKNNSSDRVHTGAPQTESKCAVRATANYRFEIIDSGPGISADIQEKLFIPFFQGNEGLVKGGTGLGLAISRKLIQIMGGTIGLQSEVGKGSTFHFTLPLMAATAPTGSLLTQHTPEPLRLLEAYSVNALIVDDIEQNREVLHQTLASLGCRVLVAESGEQALELLSFFIPDIVFTDVRMPGMDGFELRTRILEQFGVDRLKVVAISASVLAHEQQQYLQVGFHDFISKPFRVAEITACLTRLLAVRFEYELPDTMGEIGEHQNQKHQT